MRKPFAVLLVVLIAVVTLIGCGPSEEEKKAAWEKYQQTVAESQRELDARLLESEIRLVELRHGEAAAATYRMCHTYPPTTKQHQLECKRLDEQFKRDQARDAKHPW